MPPTTGDIPTACRELLTSLGSRPDPVPLHELPSAGRTLDVIEWCEDHGMAGRVVWRKATPSRTSTGPEGQQNIVVGCPADWYPAGPHDPPDRVCVALLPNGRRWLRDQRLGKDKDYPGGAAQDSEKARIELKPEARALALLVAHPEWTNKQIAAAVPCHRRTLAKWSQFRAARQTQRASKGELPHGSKDGSTGNTEAWGS